MFQFCIILNDIQKNGTAELWRATAEGGDVVLLQIYGIFNKPRKSTRFGSGSAQDKRGPRAGAETPERPPPSPLLARRGFSCV